MTTQQTTDLCERLRTKRYIRERMVEPVGMLDEPCDADDYGAEAILRNPDGPEAAATIEQLQSRISELEEERDALLQRPIDLAKMDSVDEEISDKMISYF